jgi:trimeric autotransporter adhesin
MKQFSRHTIQLAALVATAVLIFTTVQCGGSSTAATSSSTGVASVALNASSMAAGGSVQGTVTLSAAAPTGGLNLSLTSSNTAVANVQSALTIPAGSSSGTFAVTAVAPGTVVITASTVGTSSQSPSLTVTVRAVLASITLTSATVIGGDAVFGTATLTGPAPSGGAVVTLSGGDPLTVPASVTVLVGATSATFSAFTRVVGGTIPATITGSYGGATASATVSVQPPNVATANFGVSGSTETDTCTMINGGNTINCTFNGSTSTAPAPIVSWDWTYTAGTGVTFSQTTTGPVLTMPAVNCTFLPAPPLPPGDQWFPLVVTLKVHDSAGNVSAVTSNHGGARLIPTGACGF